MDGGFLEGIRSAQKLVWGPCLLGLLLGTGVYLMILLRGLPCRKLFSAVRLALGLEKASERRKAPDRIKFSNRSGIRDGRGSQRQSSSQGISAFSSLATELAATIGTGNIVGVVGAMTLGGPGALVWMVLSSILGLATKLVESTLSVQYRRTGRDGLPSGGPMITLRAAFPHRRAGKILAWLYAFFATLCAFGMGNMVQANSIAASLEASMGIDKAKAGLILSVLTILVILGGIRVISGVSSFLVPFMGAIYLLGCFGIILANLQNLFPAIQGILLAAFHPQAVSGGIFGTLTVNWVESLKWGVSRGVFSNEAGLGAAGISAAATKEAEPVRQGFISMTGVFFDTMVICVLTGIAYACSGVPQKLEAGGILLRSGVMVERTDGAGLMVAAFETAFGNVGGIFLSVCITLFAFATILGWAYQGEQAFLYLCDGRWGRIFRVAYGLAALLGAVFTLEAVWGISDICNGLLAIPNLICVLVMAPGICEKIRTFGEREL